MPKKFSKEYQPVNRRKKEQPITEEILKALKKTVQVVDLVQDHDDPEKIITVTRKVPGRKALAELALLELLKVRNGLVQLSSAHVRLFELFQNRTDGPVRQEVDLEVSKGPDVIALPADMDQELATYKQVVEEPKVDEEDSEK